MPFLLPNQQRQSTEGKIFFKTSEGKKSKLAKNQHSHGKCPIVYALINLIHFIYQKPNETDSCTPLCDQQGTEDVTICH